MHWSCAAWNFVPKIESAARLYLALFAVLIVLMKAVELAAEAKEAEQFPCMPGVLHECFISCTPSMKICRLHMQDPLDGSI